MKLLRDNASRPFPRPLIIEMGGKNPALIMRSADLDKASDGVMRSAFGATGQKCSACSRVYVSREVRDEFVELLVEKTKKIKVGIPLERDVWMGPVINERALRNYENAIERAKRDGGRILVGRPADHGRAVQPRLLRRADGHRRPAGRARALPRGTVRPDRRRGRRAHARRGHRPGQRDRVRPDGRASSRRTKREIGEFFERIQAGVTYANRRAGATTGAWPGQNSFGGWKASGSTGKGTGGPHYLQQFFREQSRTRVR